MQALKKNWFQRHFRVRRILTPRLPESRLCSTSRIGESDRALIHSGPVLESGFLADGTEMQPIQPTPLLVVREPSRPIRSCLPVTDGREWPIEHCATEPESFLVRLDRRPVSGICALIALLLLSIFALPGYSAVGEVKAIGLTVNDLDREARFFTEVLAFKEVSRRGSQGPAIDDLLDLPQERLRTAELRLGQEHITLTEHLTKKGRAICSDSRSYDHWFQHIAIVVGDMDKAYEHLRRHKVRHISTAPQTLPEWNHAAAGIKAFYFRDPEDHVLEIIWFPRGKGDPKWQLETEQLFLGIDHTAIVVSDTERSLGFYRDLLGMRVASESENYGVEQEHLNQVFGARLRITGLRAERGPGIEFLEYIAPPGGRELPDDAKANDLVFWRTDLAVDHLEDLVSKARIKPVSKHVVDLIGAETGSVRGFIVRDPDGHAIQLEQPSELAASARR
jgi:catechol 2,3-dioxygenase-like lactoylglutathione lyase family enzyme